MRRLKNRLRRAERWLSRYRWGPRALILVYHRIIDLRNDPNLLAVKPKYFAEHMELIRKDCVPIRLQWLLEGLRHGKIPRRAVVITFDDGYADNLHEAVPLLERYDIPATMFVTAGQLGSQQEFWWDELDHLVLQPGILPGKLQLNLNGSTFNFQLGEASMYTEEDYERNRDWHIARRDEPGPRQHLFRKLLAVMSTLPARDRKMILDELLAWAGSRPAAPRSTHRNLSIDELVRLQKCALAEVGAHTMTHPKLPNLCLVHQRSEIKESKQALEAILDRPVTSFAFPFGSSSPETVTIVRDEGFLCACSTRSDVVFRGADYFCLPRVVVRDWDGERFGRFLRWWMGG